MLACMGIAAMTVWAPKSCRRNSIPRKSGRQTALHNNMAAKAKRNGDYWFFIPADNDFLRTTFGSGSNQKKRKVL